MMEQKFILYSGDLMGLPTNEKHLNFRWNNKDCKVLFSITRQGNAASCHFASDKRGLRKLKKAINEFVNFTFKNFSWCEMIIAKVRRNSVAKLCRKCDFVKIHSFKNFDLYVRSK